MRRATLAMRNSRQKSKPHIPPFVSARSASPHAHQRCYATTTLHPVGDVSAMDANAVDANVETFLPTRLEAASTDDKAEDLGRKAERRRAVLAEIERRFCDPEFDLTDAARTLGLS